MQALRLCALHGLQNLVHGFEHQTSGPYVHVYQHHNGKIPAKVGIAADGSSAAELIRQVGAPRPLCWIIHCICIVQHVAPYALHVLVPDQTR